MYYVITVSQEFQSADASIHLPNACVVVENNHHIVSSAPLSCEPEGYCETSSAQDSYKNVQDEPKLGVLSRLIRKLLKSKI